MILAAVAGIAEGVVKLVRIKRVFFIATSRCYLSFTATPGRMTAQIRRKKRVRLRGARGLGR
jgi:hypothetical protein